MTKDPVAAPIVILDPDIGQSRQIAGWLRDAGLGMVSTARTCDEAIFMLGRKQASLLIIDEQVSESAERRLLAHIRSGGHPLAPALVRLISATSPYRLAIGRAMALETVQKPASAQDVVVRVGTAMQRPDLIGQLDQERNRNQAGDHLEAARRMQIGLLPTPEHLQSLHAECNVGVAAFYRSGDAVGGDFWGIWPTGRGRFALALVDFAGHGLSAALNTFRLHALLSEHTLPRGVPVRMTGLLNDRLHALLPRGQYATMFYLQVDPASRRIAWCSAGGPAPLFVSADRCDDLAARGLPLGVRPRTAYSRQHMRLPGAGLLCAFSDGLYESGAHMPDVGREAIVESLAEPARAAAAGHLVEAAEDATRRLEQLRDRYACPGHSDDIMAVCVAFGAPPSSIP